MYCAILQRLTSMNSEATTELESNQLTNFIAFGDVTGLLQVVDISQNDSKNESLPISKENSIIQHKKTTFQGLAFHKHPINRIQWNPNFEKIATVDDGNSLVVWNKGENDLIIDTLNRRKKYKKINVNGRNRVVESRGFNKSSNRRKQTKRRKNFK